MTHSDAETSQVPEGARLAFMKHILSAAAESYDIRGGFIELNIHKLTEVASVIADAFVAGRKILVCGNGGSASDACHFVGELVGRLHGERRALPAIALVCDPATMTAVANDYGYHRVFARQIEALGTKGDILLAISTSGGSRNALEALEAAKAKGMTTVGLVGALQCAMAPNCDHLLATKRGSSSARIQETHIFALHVIASLVELCLSDRGAL